MRNKKNIIIFSALILLILIITLIFLNRNQLGIIYPGEKEEIFEPEFLSIIEKQELGIPENEVIQVISRDANNEISVYKIIDSEDEAINPKEVGPISPRVISE
jgi:hypothetical protein